MDKELDVLDETETPEEKPRGRFYTVNSRGMPVPMYGLDGYAPEDKKSPADDLDQPVRQILDGQREARQMKDPQEAGRAFLGYCLNEIVVDEMAMYMRSHPELHIREYLRKTDEIKQRLLTTDRTFELAFKVYTKHYKELAGSIFSVVPFLEMYRHRDENPRCTLEMLHTIIQTAIVDLFSNHKRIALDIARGKEIPVKQAFDRDLFLSLDRDLLIELFIVVDKEISRNMATEKLIRTPIDREHEIGQYFAHKEFKAMHNPQTPTYEYDPETNQRSLIVLDVQDSKSEIKEKVQIILSTQPNRVFEDLKDIDLVYSDITFQPDEFTSRVLCALSSLLIRDDYYVSDYRIAQIVYGIDHPAKHQIDKVQRIHTQMINTWVKRNLVYKGKYDKEWKKWEKDCPLAKSPKEIDTLENKFPLLPVDDVFQRKVRGQTTTIYHYSGLPKLVLLWIDKGSTVNIPFSMLKSLFRSDRVNSQKIEVYFLTTILPMRRQRISKRNQPVFTYDTIIKSSGVDRDYERAMDDLQAILERAKREKIKGVFDFFMDDVTRKVWIWKTEKEKKDYLRTHPEYEFIKDARSHHKNRRLRLS